MMEPEIRKGIWWEVVSAIVLIVVILIMASGLSGCLSSGSIQATSIAGSFKKIRARHDAYVHADSSLVEFEKQVYLDSTELMQQVIDEALKE